jgi:hypothetical protein
MQSDSQSHSCIHRAAHGVHDLCDARTSDNSGHAPVERERFICDWRAETLAATRHELGAKETGPEDWRRNARNPATRHASKIHIVRRENKGMAGDVFVTRSRRFDVFEG